MPRWDITASQVAADSFWDSKGDLAVGSGADASVNLSVGCTDGHVLQICSCEASGLKWASAPAPTGNIDNGTSNITSGGTWSVDVDATGTDGAGLSAAGTLRLGCTQDLRIFHGGTHNYITGVTGDLVITTDGGNAAGIIFDSEDDTVEIKGSGTTQATFSASGLCLVASDVYSIAGTEVLSATALASTVKINNANWTACGADLAVVNGGTNLSVYAVGDIVYASGTTALSKLVKPGTPAGEVLTFAACASAPSWAAAGGGSCTTTNGITKVFSTLTDSCAFAVDNNEKFSMSMASCGEGFFFKVATLGCEQAAMFFAEYSNQLVKMVGSNKYETLCAGTTGCACDGKFYLTSDADSRVIWFFNREGNDRTVKVHGIGRLASVTAPASI